MFVTWFYFTQTCLYIKLLYWNYFCRFLEILRDFILSQKAKFSIPIIPVSGFCRSTGTVDRARSRSTESVDRRAQTCTPYLVGGPVDRPGRPSRELCSLESPGRPGGRPAESSALCFQATIDRGGRPLAQWSEIWPLAGRPGRSTDSRPGCNFAPTASFS